MWTDEQDDDDESIDWSIVTNCKYWDGWISAEDLADVEGQLEALCSEEHIECGLGLLLLDDDAGCTSRPTTGVFGTEGGPHDGMEGTRSSSST